MGHASCFVNCGRLEGAMFVCNTKRKLQITLTRLPCPFRLEKQRSP